MSKSIPDRKPTPGMALVSAVEAALGVEGPSALGRLTLRSQGWWSKLRNSGEGARFPRWEELGAVLPPDLPPDATQRLHARYTEALLRLYDPDSLGRIGLGRPPAFPLDDLRLVLKSAHTLGLIQGKPRDALREIALVETLLTTRGLEDLSREEVDLLGDIAEDRSMFLADSGEFDLAVSAANEAIQYRRRSGAGPGELHAQHALAIARYRAEEMWRAVEAFSRLAAEYARLGQTDELVRAERDLGNTLMRMGRLAEGEAALRRAYEAALPLTPDHRFVTVLWLADSAARRGDLRTARFWLEELDDMEARFPNEIGDWPRHRHVRRERSRLRCRVGLVG